MGSSIDRKKVINNLLIIRTWNEVGKAYAYDEIDKKEKTKTVVWIDDALELLKEQEAQPVIFDRQCEVEPGHWERKGFCPKCHQVVLWMVNREYCGFCGQKVKWNECSNP